MQKLAYTKTKEEIFKELKTSKEGLTTEEVRKRLHKYGNNKISKKRKASKILIFLKQFNSPLIYILFAAAVISFIFDHVIDAYVIAVIVLINATIGFIEERKAERAIEALETLIVSYAKVIRDEELIKVPSEELVPGDIIMLEEGDKVPADARIFDLDNFRTQESSLTGESFPEVKDNKTLEEDTPLADRTNMVFMSTMIVSGDAKAVVVATAHKTAIGQVAESIQEIVHPKVHYNKKVSQLAFQMATFAVIGAVFVFIFGYFIAKLEFFEILLFTISSLVSAIPEGLPAVLIIVLAIGARRMAKKNAVIRHLPAIETLGVATVISTDKTGTLTQNALTVEEIVTPEVEVSVTGNGWEPIGRFLKDKRPTHSLKIPSLKKLLEVATMCNEGNLLRKDGGYEIVGDPTEVALLVLGKKAGLDKQKMHEEIIDDLNFNSEYKFRATLIEQESKKREFYTVGAFEVILHNCSYVMDDNKKIKLTDDETLKFMKKAEKIAEEGMRVLALAYKEVPSSRKIASKELMNNMVFAGLVGMKDPPREGIKTAIQKARNAGIRVIMQTGDHKVTALAIAREIGLVGGKSKALTEKELKKMDDKEFRKAVKEINVFARVTPKMKLKITRTLQEQGEIVCMTGDGVNDAPALKKADVGISMGLIGTDVARESSEIVLTDDNFTSIVNAIEEGRIIFKNIRRTSFFLVTTNVAEQLTIIGSLIIGPMIIGPIISPETQSYLPLLPIQVLYLNLVTDTFAAIGLSLEPGHRDVLSQPPRDKKEKILNKDLIPFLVIISLLMVAGTIPLYYHYLPQGIDKARTVAFFSMTMFQLFNVYNMRSIKNSLFKIGIWSNKWATYALGVSFVLMLIVIYQPWIAGIFGFVPLTLKEFGLITLIGSSVFVVGEIYKRFKYSEMKIP